MRGAVIMTKRRPTGPTRHEPPEMFYVGAAIFAVVFVGVFAMWILRQ